MRLLSVFFGLFSLAALYCLARKLFGVAPALIATLALSVSFWSLMYSRFKLRHISEVGLMLLTFYFFMPQTVRCAAPLRENAAHLTRRALFAAVCLALCLYTYFAARVVPVILLAFVVYLRLFHWKIFRARWRSFALTFGLTAILVAPLAWTGANVLLALAALEHPLPVPPA